MSEHTPFLTIFPGCAPLTYAAGGLDKAYVTQVRIYAGEGRMAVDAWFAAMPSPVEISGLETRLREDYELQKVELEADYPRPKTAAAASSDIPFLER